MSEDSIKVPKSKVLDLVFKILAGGVPFVFAWAVKLEVTNAIQNERIQELQEDVQKNSGIALAVQSNTTSLVKLETKLDAVSTNIAEIKRLLSTGQ